MIQVRKATPDDALGITIVNVYTWKTAYAGLIPEELIDGRIRSLREKAENIRTSIAGDGRLMVAEADHAIVGMCMYGKSRNAQYADAGEIYALYVLQGFAGMGIGRALFAGAARELRTDGCVSMILNCLLGNPSLDFYRHMGGEIVGRREDSFNGKILTEQILRFPSLDAIAEAQASCAPGRAAR